jgi:predicted RNase H-like nuclease (RuvC/YqgF family)
MAGQNMTKPRRPGQGVPQPVPRIAAPKVGSRPVSSALETSVERLEASVEQLQRERDQMAAELSAAKEQIAALEKARKEAVDRIDWVIGSLSSSLEEKS